MHVLFLAAERGRAGDTPQTRQFDPNVIRLAGPSGRALLSLLRDMQDLLFK
jgi:hypothetical protein